MNNRKFIWTDELVDEYIEFTKLHSYAPRYLVAELFKFETLDNLQKPKPLFTTYDGVDVYTGDLVYILYGGIWSGTTNPLRLNGDNHSSTNMYFSKIEAAREYARLHKKQFSIVDIQKAARNVTEIRQNQGLIQRLTEQK